MTAYPPRLHLPKRRNFFMANNNQAILASVAAAATLTAPVHAQTASTDTRHAKNIVLVHGAFADGSGWRGVYDELTQRGYRVAIVHNPLPTLGDDVPPTRAGLDRQDGPTILVGPSWGGTVITEAGTPPNVVG